MGLYSIQLCPLRAGPEFLYGTRECYKISIVYPVQNQGGSRYRYIPVPVREIAGIAQAQNHAWQWTPFWRCPLGARTRQRDTNPCGPAYRSKRIVLNHSSVLIDHWSSCTRPHVSCLTIAIAVLGCFPAFWAENQLICCKVTINPGGSWRKEL